MLTDTHCHLYLDDFTHDMDEVIERALQNKVERLYLPNIDSTTVEAMNKLCGCFPNNCYPMMGLHPSSVKENYREELAVVEKELAAGKYYGVGETGLDFYWDRQFIPQQEEAFIHQVELSCKYHLPLSIHSRNSLSRIIELLEERSDKNVFGVFHCFPGSHEDAIRILSLGKFKFGVGGVVTYRNSLLPDVVKKTGLQHIVLETDSPYLPPVPYRGKRNESSYLVHIVQKLSEIFSMTPGEIERITAENAEEIFGRRWENR